jgi:hypothetical protein
MNAVEAGAPKRPFLVFSVITTLVVAAALVFIQSRSFAGIFKQAVFKYLPRDVGIQADFSEFAIKMFPPGMSLRNPTITLQDGNILKMPSGTSVKAERIDFEFRPFQMFTGNIRVKELTIVNGTMQLFYDPASGKAVRGKGGSPSASSIADLTTNFHWDELFQIHAEALGMQNMKIRVDWIGSNDYTELQVSSVRVAQWLGKGGLGYEVGADISGLTGSFARQFPAVQALENVQLGAHVNEAGVQLDTFAFRSAGLELVAHGSIRGNVKKPKTGLLLDAEFKASGDLAPNARQFDPRLDVQGTFAFDGRARGSLEKLLETLKLEGKANVSELHYRRFYAEHAEAQGAWTADPAGGELVLQKATLSSSERTREKPRAAGMMDSGGMVSLSDVHFRLGSHEPVAARIELKRASLQWLAALGLADPKVLYALQSRLTGTVDTILTPAPATPTGHFAISDIQARLNLKLDEFQLDNQKQDVPRPLKKIFVVPSFGIEGAIRLQHGVFHVDSATVEFPRSKLSLEGTISGPGGINLHASGPANLADLGQIAENDIRGEGTIEVAVSGPTNRILVDVDADIKNAYYLRMAYGDVHGRISWDDDPNHLLLKNVEGARGTSQFSVDGMVDVGDHESIALTAHIPQGNIQDLIQVFHEMTQDLWWFPATLAGPMSGTIDISGGLKMSELRVEANVSGSSWNYEGERFSKVTAIGGYDRGKYLLSDFRLSKRAGHMSGRISYRGNAEPSDPNAEKTGYFDWDVHTQQMTIGDIDHVARLDVPIRGRISIDSSGKGVTGAIVAQTQVEIADVSVRGVPMPPSQLTLSSANGSLQARGSALGSEGTLDLNYDFNPINVSHVHAELRRLDFSPILLLLNPKAITDSSLAGYISGAVNLSFHSGELDRAGGDIALTEYVLSKEDSRFHLLQPVKFHVMDGTFDFLGAAIAGDRGQLNFDLRGRNAQLDGKLSGSLDLSMIEFFTPAVPRATGLAALDLAIGGTLRSPLISGRITPSSPTVWVDGLESPLENITGAVALRQSILDVETVAADLAGGRAIASGKIALFSDRVPELNLRADVTNSKLKIFPFQFVKISGKLLVTGDQLPYLVEGNFAIDSALSKEKVLQRNQSTGLKSAQYTPPASSSRTGDYPKFKLKIDVHGERGILVQNELFDAEFKAHLTVVNTIEAPRLLGTIDLVQGKMTFKDHDFQLQSLSATFDNPAVIDPKINLTARTEVNGVKVQIDVNGPYGSLKPELSSTPAMSESDILSLLTIGMTTNDTKRLSSSDLAAVEQGEAASLLLNSLDFNREVANKTGLQLQLDESINPYVGASVFKPQTAGETSVAPKIVIRKQLTHNVDVSYGSTVGVGSGSEREVNVEVKMTPGASLIGVWDNYESLDTGDRQTSYGVDFKLQKRFK